MAVGDIYEVALVANAPEGLVVNVLHYRATIAGTGTDMQILNDFANAVIANIGTLWRNILPTSYTASAINVSKIRPLPRSLTVNNWTAAAGTRAVTPLPSEVAVTITKRTNFGGRKFRGRLFVSGLEQAATANGVLLLTGPYPSAVTAFANALNNQLTGPTTTVVANPVIFHRASGTYTDIQSHIPRGPLRAQRRRQAGRGA